MSDIMVLISWVVVFLFGKLVGENRGKVCREYLGVDASEIWDKESEEDEGTEKEADAVLTDVVEVSRILQDLNETHEEIKSIETGLRKILYRSLKHASDLLHLAREKKNYPEDPEEAPCACCQKADEGEACHCGCEGDETELRESETELREDESVPPEDDSAVECDDEDLPGAENVMGADE